MIQPRSHTQSQRLSLLFPSPVFFLMADDLFSALCGGDPKSAIQANAWEVNTQDQPYLVVICERRPLRCTCRCFIIMFQGFCGDQGTDVTEARDTGVEVEGEDEVKLRHPRFSGNFSTSPTLG